MSKLVQACLSVELALAANGELPTEVRLFKNGANRTKNGTYMFTAESARTCMAAFEEWGVDLAFDYHHAMRSAQFANDPAMAGAAAGWGKLAVKNDANGNPELHAVQLSWTPKGAKILTDREMRYCSPMFNATEDGTVVDILNCALTALPATFGADPLMATLTPVAPKDAKPMKTLLTLLSLPVDASEDKAAAAVMALTSDRTALLSAAGATTLSEALGKVEGWKASAAQHVELSRKFAELEVAGKKSKVQALLSVAVKEGKVAPAELEPLTAMGEADVVRLESYLSVKPKVLAVPALEPAGAGGVGGTPANLTPEQLAVAQQMGHDPAKLAASIAKFGTVIPVVVTQKA